MKKIIIDAFGGDNSPKEVVAGAVEALAENKNFIAVLCGKQDVIEQELANYTFDNARVEILPAEEVITCEEEPTLAVRRKPNSSICVGFKELKENSEASAFVSAGSTGAVLVGATLRLGRIAGVNRPALCAELPTAMGDKKVLLMDTGANADCKSINLCQFALMGTAYAEACGIKNPKVALLSNGTEDEKGNALNHEVFPLLKQMKGINFVGNAEGRDILSGEYDVVVSDGFSGNIALKSAEGAMKTLFSVLKEEIYSSVRGKIGGMLLKPTFGKIKEKLSHSNKGGALFVGVGKTVVKAHGSSNRTAIKNAILQAISYSDFDLSNRISQKLTEWDNAE